MNSGYQKDKLREVDEAWALDWTAYTNMDDEYQAFKIFYTKKLWTIYTDSYKKHIAKSQKKKLGTRYQQ